MSLGRLLGCIALVEVLAGCYVQQPVMGAGGPQPGTMLGMDVNDVGRLALGGQMGPEIVHVEGRLISAQGDEYELAVRSVKLIRGGDQVWNWERVRIKKDYIANTYERRFSKSQTLALGAVAAAGVVYVATKLNLFGLGKPDPDKAPCDSSLAGTPTGCGTEARFPRRP